MFDERVRAHRGWCAGNASIIICTCPENTTYWRPLTRERGPCRTTQTRGATLLSVLCGLRVEQRRAARPPWPLLFFFFAPRYKHERLFRKRETFSFVLKLFPRNVDPQNACARHAFLCIAHTHARLHRWRSNKTVL